MQNVNTEILIVGLGNPGDRYQNTLHNVGFKIVERLAEKLGASWKYESRFQALLAKGKLNETTYHLLCPLTFMNLSGEAVRAYLQFTKLNVKQVIIIADDADLPLGDLRMRTHGGTGGHNGLKSVEKELQTSLYPRLRVGIGRPEIKEVSLADYVLTPQGQDVWAKLEPTIVRSTLLLERLAKEPLEAVISSI